MSKAQVAQIQSIKNPISSNLSNGNSNSNVSEADLRRPTRVAKNAAPAVRNFYQELDLFKTEALNFGIRFDKMADVRADYIKTIKFASNEFVELVESGKISYEEGAIRANKLRNVLFEISRRKDWDLGRSIAEYMNRSKPLNGF